MGNNIEVTVFQPKSVSPLKGLFRSIVYPDHQQKAEKMMVKVGDNSYRFHPDEVSLEDVVLRATGHTPEVLHGNLEDLSITRINESRLLEIPDGPHNPQFYDFNGSDWQNHYFEIRQGENSPHAVSFYNIYYGGEGWLTDGDNINREFRERTGGIKDYFQNSKPDITNVDIGNKTYATFEYEGATYGIDVTAQPVNVLHSGIHVLTEDGEKGPEIQGIEWETVRDYIAEYQPSASVIYDEAGWIDSIAFEYEGQMVATHPFNLRFNHDLNIGGLPGELLLINPSYFNETSDYISEKYFVKIDGTADPLSDVLSKFEEMYRLAIYNKDQAMGALDRDMSGADDYLVKKESDSTASGNIYLPYEYVDITPEIIEAMYESFNERGIDIQTLPVSDVTHDPLTHAEFLQEQNM